LWRQADAKKKLDEEARLAAEKKRLEDEAAEKKRLADEVGFFCSLLFFLPSYKFSFVRFLVSTPCMDEQAIKAGDLAQAQALYSSAQHLRPENEGYGQMKNKLSRVNELTALGLLFPFYFCLDLLFSLNDSTHICSQEVLIGEGA
jgi:hypothetical protein